MTDLEEGPEYDDEIQPIELTLEEKLEGSQNEIKELQDKLVSWQNYGLTLQRILQILTNEELEWKVAALSAMDEREKVIVLFKPALGLAHTLDDCFVEKGDEEDDG